jgi:transcription elongation factor GreA
MDKIPMTEEGAEALRNELKRLTSVERPRIVQEISAALEQGDLRENAEFQYAKEEQEIAPSGRVIFGTTVRLLNVESDEEVTYKIVGDDEADIKQGTISIYSPVARSLVGKQVDDVVLIQIPSGKIEYEILSVEHL